MNPLRVMRGKENWVVMLNTENNVSLAPFF